MDPVQAFCEAIVTADFSSTEYLDPEIEFDATVPNWRFTLAGRDRLVPQLAQWYADPGTFDELVRTPLPTGELVEFTLTWEERGVPHAAHQIHVLEIADGRIRSDRMFCGGRWPAQLLAEMEAAAHAR
jgi:hypothetical protein